MSEAPSREELQKMSRKDLVDGLFGSNGHISLLQKEWAASEIRHNVTQKQLRETIARLEEANAVIIEASRVLTTDSEVFWMLDDADGSGDACRRLEKQGYRRTGDGSWYPPTGKVDE